MKQKREKQKFSKKKMFVYLLLVILILYITNILYHTTKTLPEGLSYRGSVYEVNESDVNFVYDLTYSNTDGKLITNHQIYDDVFKNINEAENFVLLDIFLIDRNYDKKVYRHLSKELVDSLISRKKENQKLQIFFMTDKYNDFYGSVKNKNFEELNENGIDVNFGDNRILRDSNPFYSGMWRIFFSWSGLPNHDCENSLIKYNGNKICFRSIANAVNFKANHRKLIVINKIENGKRKAVSVFTSSNPSDYGSRHSNVGLIVDEDAFTKGLWTDILFSEKTFAEKSGEKYLDVEIPNKRKDLVGVRPQDGKAYVQFLSEKKIKDDLINEINFLDDGEEMEIAQFLLTDRDVINSLLSASDRGAKIKIILDPSKQLFGKATGGIPNLAAASDLIEKSKNDKFPIEVKFYNTHEEEFHTKIMIIKKKDGRLIVYIGSANLTKRNLNDLNMEADVKLITRNNSEVGLEITDYFEKLWGNEDGNNYTEGYESKPKISSYKYLKYRVQEASGFCAW